MVIIVSPAVEGVDRELFDHDLFLVPRPETRLWSPQVTEDGKANPFKINLEAEQQVRARGRSHVDLIRGSREKDCVCVSICVYLHSLYVCICLF